MRFEPTPRVFSPETPFIIEEMLPLHTRVKGAALNWLLMAYDSILLATLRLLTCVSIPGRTGTYLYYDANRSCSSAKWLGPLVVLLVLGVLFALLLPVITVYLRRNEVRFPGMYRNLTEHFNDDTYWWESVLLMQRLLLLFFSTFLSPFPTLRAMMTAFVCVTGLMLHMYFKPMHHKRMQLLQGVFLSSLVVLSLANIVAATNLQNATVQAASLSTAVSIARHLVLVLNFVFVYVVPPLCLLSTFSWTAVETLWLDKLTSQ